MRPSATARLALIGLGLAACYSGEQSESASGPETTLATESGATESGAAESGATESGATESGATESGATESGATESGATEGGATEGGATEGDGGEPADPLAELDRYSADDARAYLSSIAPMVVGRLLTDSELNLIDYFGGRGIVPVLDGWIEDAAFPETVRMMIQVKLHASGMTDTIDFELPGNLAAQIARDDLPFAEIITADRCVDGAGADVECDTGAPYNAGVLTTRAYLIANASRFNLQRARRMMYIFNCLLYPMDTVLQPPLAKDSMIPMFRALTPEEQTEEEAQSGFGNGFACYSCHSQFGAHAQLFVKFDQDGLYRPEATGLQDPEDELGRSADGLFVSHFVDSIAAEQELSQVFGEPVANLAEAGEVLSSHPTFTQCSARNVIEWTFGLTEADAATTAPALLVAIAERIFAEQPEPSIGDIFRATLTHPDVIDVFLDSKSARPSAPGALQ